MTHWLTAEQQKHWRSYLAATTLLSDRLSRELQVEHGLSLADYEILVRLSEADGRRLRMSQLAESTQYSRSRLSHAVGRMEVAGWVRREECPTDRRGTVAVLTDAGWRTLERAAPGHVREVRAGVFDLLTRAQVRQLGAISERIAAHLETGTDPG